MNVHPRYHQNCLCLQKKTNRQLKVKIFNTIHVSNSGERVGNGDWAQSPMTTDSISMPLYWNLNKNPWTLVFRELSGWWTQGGDVRVLGSRGYGGSAHLHSAFALPVSSISLSPSFIFYNNMGTVSEVFPEFSRWFYSYWTWRWSHGTSDFWPLGCKYELFEITWLASELRTILSPQRAESAVIPSIPIRNKRTCWTPSGCLGNQLLLVRTPHIWCQG